MVCKFVKLLYSFDVSAYNCLFLFEYPNIAVYFDVAELVVIEIFKRGWHLVFAFMVKKYVESSSIVIDLELSSHWFLDTTQESAADDDVGYRIAFKFTNVIRSR